MMTRDEWDATCVLLDKWFIWKPPFGEVEAAAYAMALEEYSAAQITAALRALVAAGQEWGPKPGIIIGLIGGDDASTPTFAEAYQLIYAKGGILRARPSGSTWDTAAAMDRAYDDAALERARGMHPLVASFADRQGVRRLRLLPVEHEDHGELVRKDLERAWNQHVDAMRGRDLAEIAAGVGRGQSGLNRFDPLAALNGHAPRETAGELEAGR